MPIQILAEDVVARIAAGEVVERPASVVKELIENAIDAGADNIHIDIQGSGRQQIRISDNGDGIRRQEVSLALTRHATSKLRHTEDLETLTTLGFRGEALASISAVSQLSITTRHRHEDIGTSIRVDGGQIVDEKSAGVPAGTVINVENLFFNTPARLKFLKSDNTEKRQIMTVVTRYTMAYPEIRFVLLQDGRELFRSNGRGQLADVVAKVLGLDNFKQMIEVSGEEVGRDGYPNIQVQGFVSQPSLSRSDRTRIILFINGRAIQDNRLNHAVIQAYHTLLMKGRYPYAVLMIAMPTNFVDVNVHPTKAEVRFQKPDLAFVAVQRTIRKALLEYVSVREFHDTGYGAEFPRKQDDKTFWSTGNRDADTYQSDLVLDYESPGYHPRQYPDDTFIAGGTEIPYGLGMPERPRTLPLLRVIGQVGATYIVAEGPAGMYLIDQHAAHERIMYEKFMESYRTNDIVTQQTLELQTLNVSPEDARLIEEKQELLQALGFNLEAFGPNTFAVRRIPALLANIDSNEVILQTLEDLAQDKTPGEEAIEEKLIQHVCKRASVKAGQILSLDEMQGIIRQLERCESPHTCPHGRPTLIHLSKDQLAREFGRLG